MNEQDMSKINSKKAKAEFKARKQMQANHLEEKFGKLRKLEMDRYQTEQNFAVLNWILTLHNFSHLKGMDLLNAIQRMMLVHYNSFEEKVKVMEAALGEEKMMAIGIDPKMLYPTTYAMAGLKEVQRAARERSKAGKYGLELAKPKKIITGES